MEPLTRRPRGWLLRSLVACAWILGAVVWLHPDWVFGDQRAAPTWYDQNAIATAPDWHYRVPVTIPAGTPVNSTIRVDVDFNALLAQLGVTGTFDVNSPRVVRSTGALSTNQEFTDAVYANATDATGNGRGEVRFILQDAGPVTYQIYFDITANGAKAANPQVPINGSFEFGGTGAEDPPGWTATKANANFDAQVRPSENPSITTNAPGGAGNAALPSATVVTDGTPFRGNFSYLLGGRTNNEPSTSNPSVTLDKTIVVPASCASGFTMRYRVEGWDSSANGSANYDFLRVRLIGGATVEVLGPTLGSYTTLPFSPNLGTVVATTTQSGYRQYNGWDTDTTGTHRSGMTVAPGTQPWWTATNNMATLLGQTITLRITSRNTTEYKSWWHIDQVEWCVVNGTLGTPVAFGVNITAPPPATTFTVGQTLSVTAQSDAQATAAANPAVAYVFNPSGGLVVGPVALASGGGGVYSNPAVYTFLASDPGGTWTVRVFSKDASTSTIGATNGLIHIVGQPNTPESQANFHNVDEQTFDYTSPLGGFNAYETTTAAGAVNGVIRTKVAGTAFNLDVIALNQAKTAILTAFTGTVRVEVVDASGGGAPDADGCVAAWPVVHTVAPDPTFVAGNNGRRTVSFTVPNSYRNARVRVIFPAGAAYAAAQAKGCSNDNFAVRPASFSISVTDQTWDTAPGARALNNTGTVGGNVHKAGRPFRITVTPAPGSVTNYDGTPTTVAALACTLPAGCANGTLDPGAFSGTGTPVSDTATYTEAGAFNLTLEDRTYANVDILAGDGTPLNCAATGAYVCQSPGAVAVGRFVPDRFAVAAVTQPTFRTFDATDASCSVPPSGPRRSFTYIGQPFGYQANYAATITAQNATGGTTTNYRGTLWKLTNASATQTFANSPVMTMDATLINAPTVAETPNTGTGTINPNAGDKLAYSRDSANPQAAFTANLSLTLSVSDASEAGANQGTISTTTPLVFNGGGTGVAFDAGALFRYGRLQLANARGAETVALSVPMEMQYWNGSAFVVNSADHCTTLAAANFGLGNYAGNLGSGETTLSLPAGAFLSGRKTLSMSAPGAGNNGSVDIVLDLGPTSTIDSCTTWGTTPTPTGANKAWLRSRWCGATHTKDTVGRATFGVSLGSEDVIFQRENF